MSNEINKVDPTMPREFLEDVVSIKVSEVETLLEEKQLELEEALKSQDVEVQAKTEQLEKACKKDAEEQVGGKLKAISEAFNASELFPEMDYAVGSGYGSHDLKTVEDYGVSVEIVVKQDPKAAKIARGGLPISTTTSGTSRSGLKIIAATTAIIKVTPEVVSAQTALDEANATRTELQTKIEQTRKYLSNMNSSERKIRAAVAKNHLTQNNVGQDAINFLNTLTLPDSLGKGVTKLLPAGK
jgi:uncharacterized protein YwbE